MRRALALSFVVSICLAAAPAGAANVWTSIGPDGGQILALEADSRKPGVLYAGTGQGVFKSTDGGTTWLRASQGLMRRGVYDVAVAADSSVVYTSGEGGIFVSRDAGATWSGPRLHSAYTTSVAVDPHNARRVWASNIDFLYRSDDAGATWSEVYTGINITHARDIAVDPFRPDTLYAVSLAVQGYGVTQVIKSTDAGKTWVRLGGGLEPSSDESSAQLAVDPTTPDLLYVSFDVATWRSTDGGATWHRTEGGHPIAVDRQGVVYAGDMRSTDHGQTWQRAAALPAPPLCYAAGDGTLWAGTNGLGVFRSRDRAATWESARRGLHATSVTSFAIDPERPRVIYAGAGVAGVLKTLSTGAGWRQVDSGLPASARDYPAHHVLALDPRQPQTIYLAWDDGFARSDDGGEHWTALQENADDVLFDVSNVVVDPATPKVVYLNGTEVGAPDETCRLARSNDRGVTFRCLPPFRHTAGRLILDAARPGTLWMMTWQPDRLWKSTDRGAHWTGIRLRGLANAGDPRSLAIDPSHDGRLFLGTDAEIGYGDRPERIWRSDDGGLSWRAWGRGLPAASSVTQLLIDPKQPSIFYAAVLDNDYSFSPSDRSGIYWSRDGGRTFRPAGLTGYVLQLTQDPKNPRKLYASIWGRGIYTWMRP